MKVSQFLKNSAFLALAGAMTVTAIPAQAREPRNAESPADRQGARGQAAVAAARAAAPQRAAPQRAAPVQVAQRGNDGGGRSWGRGSDGQRGQSAQAPGRGSDRAGDRGGTRGSGWQRPQQQQAQPPVRQQPQAQGQWRGERNGTYSSPDRNRTYRSDDRRDGRDWRDNRDGRDGRYERRDGYRDGYRAGQRDYRQWDRRWRDDRRYDWNGWRSRNRTTFNIGIYYSPYRNYSYRRLGIGYSLNSLFYSSRYWINDPWQYRLPEVYGPYRWVRYYDDVLLVDVYSGEVVDVIYDFFW